MSLHPFVKRIREEAGLAQKPKELYALYLSVMEHFDIASFAEVSWEQAAAANADDKPDAACLLQVLAVRWEAIHVE